MADIMKCVYVIKESNTNNYKIGLTCDLKSRVPSLQTGNPRVLTVVAKIECVNVAKLEKESH